MNIAKRITKFWDIYYGWIIVAIALVSMGFWLVSGWLLSGKCACIEHEIINWSCCLFH
ncbi:MAG: hypothetical protein JRH04_10515 [Deltaproteobacteria bacterium]|nr:hypothetical protein [Deltaproteobacteria bacterium]